MAYQLTGDAHRGDDVVQQAITRLYVHWRRARDADNLDAYVHTMLLRVFLDEKRLSWARVHLVDAVPETAGPPSSDVARPLDPNRLMRVGWRFGGSCQLG